MNKTAFRERVDPVQQAYAWMRWRRRAWIALLLAILGVIIYWRFLIAVPVDYESNVDHFKYGSIGSDYDGIPLAIWKILPATFPEHLPESGRGFLQTIRENPETPTHLAGYSQFGFSIETDRELPVGFSKRRVYVDRVGLNCAICHTSTLRVSSREQAQMLVGSGDTPSYIGGMGERGDGRVLVLGMPANTMDLEAYFTFLFRCAADTRFTREVLMTSIDQAVKSGQLAKPGPIERLILKRAVGQLRTTLLTRRQQLHYLAMLPHHAGDDVIPRFGPGRVDTFSPYKSIQFAFPFDGTYGIADYPSIWNQRPREGMNLHWDGNNRSVFERNISASLGAGATPVSLDMRRMLRVADWIGSPRPTAVAGSPTELPEPKSPPADPYRPRDDELPIPTYPFEYDSALASRGKKLFRQYCARCHGDWSDPHWQAPKTNSKLPGLGEVVDIADIQTDPARLDSYTEELQANQNLLGAGQWWRFHNFRKTHGYANAPLDGVWIRAPYLHNGSVPTLFDLFSRPCSSEDYERLGITASDFPSLADSPERVAKIIAQARASGVRPPVFYRGDDVYDPVNGGFRCDRRRSNDGRQLFFYSTVAIDNGKVRRLLGNGHEGHYGRVFDDGASYGTELSAEERRALVEYQKLIGSEFARRLP